MTHSLRRLTAAALSAAVLAAVPMAGVIVFTPAISSACLPGETAGADACAAFCLPGKALDVATGLCVPVPNPAPNGVNPPIYPPDSA
ncbi:hypothetical protein [Mycobacterium sp. ITM-2016-00318]|uniref:hypothetical protein n=1 Tax=Mycobacterium sp. ITM-2016-00318 TaxID=2099693 RepID=UPI000CF8C690|nr:hypothetical protein [Mycobacterium sp. ITM-2016-00318]WNG92837.1 hypothetical protein C6A82_026345 [Mycobacterium sp. ITM-2016-00318]